MALISCYECDSEISEKAKSCPKCGAPSLVDEILLRLESNPIKGYRIIWIIFGILGIILGVETMNGIGNYPPSDGLFSLWAGVGLLLYVAADMTYRKESTKESWSFYYVFFSVYALVSIIVVGLLWIVDNFSKF